jgi:hypothetical protein
LKGARRVRAGGFGKRIGGNADTAPGADPTLLHALHQYEQHHNTHRPHRGINNGRPLQPLPTPITNPDAIAQLNIRRHDRLDGLLHEYEHAA